MKGAYAMQIAIMTQYVLAAIVFLATVVVIIVTWRQKKGKGKVKALVIARDGKLRRALDAAYRKDGLNVISFTRLEDGLKDSLERWKSLPQVVFFANPSDTSGGVSILYDEDLNRSGRRLAWGRKIKSIFVSLRIGDGDGRYKEVMVAARKIGFNECMGRKDIGDEDGIISSQELKTVLRNLGLIPW